MLAVTLLAASLLPLRQPSVDSAAVYSAILTQVRAEHPALPVALAETRSGVACMPHCGARLRDADAAAPAAEERVGESHSAVLLSALTERGLVDRTCAVRPRVFGCPDAPAHLFVALGEISAEPPEGPPPVPGGVWVRAAFLVPCERDCTRAPGEPYFPDAFGSWFLLEADACGAWRVVRRLPAFAT